MSTRSEALFHPVNGTCEQTWEGFSWPAFFFGIIWILVKGLYAQAVIAIIISVVTAGFAVPVLWVVYGFMGNGLHKTALLKKGYLTGAQNRQGKSTARPTMNQAPSNPNDFVEKLTALAKLKESGALTQAEFEVQKLKILGAA